jgi:hypothetical protein
MDGAGLADVCFVDPATYYADEPRLADLHSPTHVVTAVAR